MPAGDYIPRSDTIFQDWVGNFLSVANANLTSLGFLASDMTAITTDKTLFDTTITNNATAQALAQAAAKKKQITRKALELKARGLVKRIQAKTDVSPDLKRQLQITVPGDAPPPPDIPNQPLDLVANIAGEGSYELKWKRNNPIGTIMFVVEGRFGASPNFTFIGITPKSTFLHENNVPGERIAYRVKIQRGEKHSPYSNTAVVNDVA